MHVGKGSRLWAPIRISIGHCVYIGKDVSIEANCTIGDFVLMANRVAIVGRRDHDFRRIGRPVRYAPWIVETDYPADWKREEAVIETDVWLGFGCTVLTGVRIGRGAVVAAGSIVTQDVPAYSIVAGNPAGVVGRRFETAEQIAEHEHILATTEFIPSESGPGGHLNWTSRRLESAEREQR